MLESFDGAGWMRASRATTGPRGGARWRFTLDAGSYRVRVRFGGTDDLQAATSRPLSLAVSRT